MDRGTDEDLDANQENMSVFRVLVPFTLEKQFLI